MLTELTVTAHSNFQISHSGFCLNFTENSVPCESLALEGSLNTFVLKLARIDHHIKGVCPLTINI